MPGRTWPAADLAFPRSAGSAPDADGFFAAFLDDYAPTAIVDTSSASQPAWRVFFADAAQRDRAVAAIGAAWPDLSARPVDVPDEQWAERSQASLRAIRVGSLVVTPPWDLERASRDQVESDEAPPEGAPIVVVIEPSMGFGTGHHESTRLCLRALQRLALGGRTVLDLGTGSGVLAIAAARLGAGRVLAVDDDPDAVRAAQENAVLNGVEAVVEVREADLSSLAAGTADVVVGNLTGGLLRRYAGEVSRHVAASGALVLSGFTADERHAVTHAFEPLQVTGELVENDWLALILSWRR